MRRRRQRLPKHGPVAGQRVLVPVVGLAVLRVTAPAAGGLLAAEALQLDEVPAVRVAALVEFLAEGGDLCFYYCFLMPTQEGVVSGWLVET